MSARDDIICQAKQFFAEKGYGGTTMDELAKKANVNKATIYYYFKDKERLYEHIFSDSIDSVVSDLERRLQNIDDAENSLKAYIDAFYFHAKKDETFIRMLLREAAGGGGSFPKTATKRFVSMLFILENILERGYKTGIFKQSDTKLIHFMIVGGVSFFLTTKHIRKDISKSLNSVPKNFGDSKDINESLYKIIFKGLGVK